MHYPYPALYLTLKLNLIPYIITNPLPTPTTVPTKSKLQTQPQPQTVSPISSSAL